MWLESWIENYFSFQKAPHTISMAHPVPPPHFSEFAVIHTASQTLPLLTRGDMWHVSLLPSSSHPHQLPWLIRSTYNFQGLADEEPRMQWTGAKCFCWHCSSVALWSSLFHSREVQGSPRWWEESSENCKCGHLSKSPLPFALPTLCPSSLSPGI